MYRKCRDSGAAARGAMNMFRMGVKKVGNNTKVGCGNPCASWHCANVLPLFNASTCFFLHITQEKDSAILFERVLNFV
jgi:hypothetical protein